MRCVGISSDCPAGAPAGLLTAAVAAAAAVVVVAVAVVAVAVELGALVAMMLLRLSRGHVGWRSRR